jgi:hypothetical protein
MIVLVALALPLLTRASGHTVSVTHTNASCNSLCNGAAAGSVSGGAGPFGYNWTPGIIVGNGTLNVTNLCAGVYTLTVTDSSDMSTAAATVTISQPSPLSAGIASPLTVCAGGGGGPTCTMANVSAAGGTPAYTYYWSPATGVSSPTVANPMLCFSGMGSQTYTITVMDANGCAATITTTLNADMPFSTITSAPPSACGLCDGSLTASAFGGFPPYSYNWGGGVTTATYGGLCSGTSVNVLVTDAYGCGSNVGGTVPAAADVPVVLDSIIDINCSGSLFGTIGVHGGSAATPYTYAWTTSPVNTNPVLTGLSAGSYTVTATNALGCAASAVYTVNNSSSLFASVTTSYANCMNPGSATITATGAHPPYTYLWNDPMAQTTATATGLFAGTYNVQVTDAMGCSLSGNLTINAACNNVIRGRVYNDVNVNCLMDGGEMGMGGRVVTASPGPYYGSTDVNGDYTIETPNMNNVITLASYPGYTGSCGGSLPVNFTTPGDTVSSNNIGSYHPVINDLSIHPGWTSGNPGFPKTYWFLYSNSGSNAVNATVNFVYDSSLVFTGCTAGGVNNPATHTITWNFPSLAPGSYWDWATRPQAFFTVPATMSITDNLQTYFEITPIAGDVTPFDNVLNLTEPVTGSHDPNSKSVIPKGQGPGGDIYQSDSVLFYTIHFQNNGNDTAYTVVVKDTLSSFLDPASIIPGASDHPYTFELSGQGILTFRFDHIMLPDSAADEPGSNGYFNYSVKVKAGTPVGSVISNTASIYFDFNSAIVTNTTVNTIVDIAAGIETQSTNAAVKVFPNPFSDNTTFMIRSEQLNETYVFELKDVLGKTVKSLKTTERQFSVSRVGLRGGMYFYSITTTEGVVGIGKIVIK